MLKDMKTHTHLKPGQKGTRRLVEKFGDALLCVRYRYDAIRGVRLKTVEIVVEEKPCKSFLRYKDEDIVSLILSYTKKDLRDKLKALGGEMEPGGKTLACAFRVNPRGQRVGREDFKGLTRRREKSLSPL
jgi:hypothetical protein